MTDDKQVKVKSFRIDDETSEKFKEIANKIGGNQQETLSKLIQAFEFQQGKTILVDRKPDIDKFERYTSALVNMYMQSLEDNQNITETVQVTFDSSLRSKDIIIQELQEKIAKEKQSKNEFNLKMIKAIEDKDLLSEQLDNANNEISRLQDLLNEKEKLNIAISESTNTLKEKLASAQASINSVNDLKNQLSIEQENNKNLSIELEEAEHKLQRAEEQAQLTLEKSLLELKKDYEKQIEEITQKYQTKIDDYQEKLLDALTPKKNK